jgi:hypothetical protein
MLHNVTPDRFTLKFLYADGCVTTTPLSQSAGTSTHSDSEDEIAQHVQTVDHRHTAVLEQLAESDDTICIDIAPGGLPINSSTDE